MTRTYRISDQGRREMAERMKRLNADPEFAARSSAAASERMKRLNADPEFATAASERMKRLNADPEFATAASERMKRLHNLRRTLRLLPTCWI